MKKASYIFEILKAELHSEKFANTYKLSSKAFVRCRLLPFTKIFSFILNLLRKSIPKELNFFCKYVGADKTTRSAVTQARANLSAQAFVKLKNTLIEEFYSDNHFKTFEGLMLLAIDGSTIQLPNSSELIEKYGCASNQTKNKMPMARTSFLYDTLNSITLDASIEPYNESERHMAIQHFEAIKPLKIDLRKALVIFDRGYPSLSLIVYLLKNGINFLIRSGRGFLKEVKEVVDTNKKDKVLTIKLKRATRNAKSELIELFPDIHLEEEICFRVVVVQLSTGEKEILLTSLLCKKTYPRKIFLNLYFKRWRVEEGYKFYKSGVEIESFSGRSSLIIEQDFHATVLAVNAHALLKLEAEEEIKNKESYEKKYEYGINKKVSIQGLKNEFVKVLMLPEANIEAFCLEIKKIMKKDLIPRRPGRSFKRLRKYPHRKYHMNQR